VVVVVIVEAGSCGPTMIVVVTAEPATREQLVAGTTKVVVAWEACVVRVSVAVAVATTVRRPEGP